VRADSPFNPHPLVIQLQFARAEFKRCLDGVYPEDAQKLIQPLNCISWIIGHLANQEHRYWVESAQGISVVEGLNDLVGYGKPPSAPPLAEMWEVWGKVSQAADVYLLNLTEDKLKDYLFRDDKPVSENTGTMLLRNIYHYWFHTGEAHAIRQMLGHKKLPQFVGDMSGAIYR
jgi:hypothetical protein